MKKIYTICLAAALLLAASCTKPDTPTSGTRPNTSIQTPHEADLISYSITVSKSEDATKVAVTDDGANVTSVTWEAGDAVRVYNTHTDWSAGGYQATLTSGAGESTATFEFEAPVNRNPGFFVVYGATANLLNGSVNIEVPSTVPVSAKPILAGHTDAEGSIGSVNLQAVCAYMKVTLSDAADAVRFFAGNNAVASERLAGTITYGANGQGSTTPAKDPILTVTNPSNTFYVNILPCSLSKGYIIDVVKGSEHMIKSAGYTSGKTFEPSFNKLALPAFAPINGITATVAAKTTYSQYHDNQKGTDGEGANNAANTNKVWGCTAPLTAAENISNTLKSHLKPLFFCDGTAMPDGELDGVAQGSHTVTADYAFVCGGVSIPLASTVTPATAHITGLPQVYNTINNNNKLSTLWSSSKSEYNNTVNCIVLGKGEDNASLACNLYASSNVSYTLKASFGAKYYATTGQNWGNSRYATCYIGIGNTPSTSGSSVAKLGATNNLTSYETISKENLTISSSQKVFLYSSLAASSGTLATQLDIYKISILYQ